MVGEAGDDVPVQIDRVQFDMGDGVQQRDAAGGRAGAAAGHVAGVKQVGFRRGGRVASGGVAWPMAQGRASRAGGTPCGGMGAAKGGLGAAVGGGQHLLPPFRPAWSCAGFHLGQHVGGVALDAVDLPDLGDLALAVDQEGGPQHTLHQFAKKQFFPEGPPVFHHLAAVIG